MGVNNTKAFVQYNGGIPVIQINHCNYGNVEYSVTARCKENAVEENYAQEIVLQEEKELKAIQENQKPCEVVKQKQDTYEHDISNSAEEKKLHEEQESYEEHEVEQPVELNRPQLCDEDPPFKNIHVSIGLNTKTVTFLRSVSVSELKFHNFPYNMVLL